MKKHMLAVEDTFDYLMNLKVARYRLDYYFENDTTLIFIAAPHSYKNQKINLDLDPQLFPVGDPVGNSIKNPIKEKLSQSIIALKNHTISQCYYREEFYNFVYLIGFDEYEHGSTNFYMHLLNIADTTKHKNYYYKIFVIRENIVILGEPDY
ncbi:hypothetical protein [Chondrinema litorale]|uniref:hypothetical protein n=1 Tax=Chondrinema litorale TaxID=2994555 RepID=UPI0025433B4A|nr:hypothetical protein [Chondrinema litorale]UZR99990.1 hypothetical protein OQ292_39100 [Chondrinema litorale]